MARMREEVIIDGRNLADPVPFGSGVSSVEIDVRLARIEAFLNHSVPGWWELLKKRASYRKMEEWK